MGEQHEGRRSVVAEDEKMDQNSRTGRKSPHGYICEPIARHREPDQPIARKFSENLLDAGLREP